MDFNKVFPRSTDPISILDFLNNSTYDDLIEVDLTNNKCRTIHHCENKLFIPMPSGTYTELFEYSLSHMIYPEDRDAYLELLNPKTILDKLNASDYPGMLVGEFRYKATDGGYIWVMQVVIGGNKFKLPNDIIHLYVFDIQSRKSRELGSRQKEEKTYVKDNLTGLYNGASFFEIAKEFLKTRKKDWCVITIDLENFRLFNEWYGREAGNLLLGEIGSLLSDIEVITDGLAGYFGQDDFAILVPYNMEKIKKLYNNIHDIIISRGNSVGFLPAFGICMVNEEFTILDLFDHAKQATNFAKKSFHNRIRFFYQEMNEKKKYEYKLLSDFQEALRKGEIIFYLQPQVVAKNKKIVGAEALARWRKADGTFVSPAEFVPTLEKYGFVSDLDEYIWDRVCKYIKELINKGIKPVPVSLNISQTDILTIDVAKTFTSLINKYSIPSNLIKVEITESAYAENTDIVKETVRQLQEAGFLILMDDFGSGYSALSMLRNINVDILKIDAQFLRMNSIDEERGVHIVESVVGMTKNMGLPIIFEGVETEKQKDFLQQIGCQYIQGFYFFKPMPKEDFTALISNKDNVEYSGIKFNANNQFRLREFLDENIYSDSMLNNVLGPVAIYSWKDDSVDIIRFNEQFFESVNASDFSQRLKNIGRFVSENQREGFYQMFAKATTDYLNGASGTFTFSKADGSEVNFFIHVYYIGEDGDRKKFYGSAKDVTEIIDFNNKMNVLSTFLTDCIVIMKNRGKLYSSDIVIYGNQNLIGLSREELTNELNNGTFYNHIDEADRKRIFDLTVYSQKNKSNFTARFHLQVSGGENIPMRMKVCRINEKQYNSDYILILSADIN